MAIFGDQECTRTNRVDPQLRIRIIELPDPPCLYYHPLGRVPYL